MKRRPYLAGVCRWCDQPVLNPAGAPTKATWHSACVDAFKLIHWPAETRKAVLARDHGICARCGLDCIRQKRVMEGTLSLDNWLMRREAERLFGTWGNHWSCAEGHHWKNKQFETQRQHFGFPPANASHWQHDHIRPLVEANADITFWHLENIQTLCHRCHVEKGKEDNQRRKQAKEGPDLQRPLFEMAA